MLRHEFLGSLVVESRTHYYGYLLTDQVPWTLSLWSAPVWSLSQAEPLGQTVWVGLGPLSPCCSETLTVKSGWACKSCGEEIAKRNHARRRFILRGPAQRFSDLSNVVEYLDLWACDFLRALLMAEDVRSYADEFSSKSVAHVKHFSVKRESEALALCSRAAREVLASDY